MQKCVVTSFDERYWHDWGASFVGSLMDLAMLDGQLLVINIGLSYRVLERLKGIGAQIIPAVSEFGPPIDRFLALARHAQQEQGLYAYWEADAYFQREINDAFCERLGYCLDRSDIGNHHRPNTGFLCGSSRTWKHFASFLRFAAALGETDQSALEAFIRCFPSLTEKRPLTWNCTAMGNLKWDGGYRLDGNVVHVVHPSGPIKHMADGWPYLFRVKYKAIYDDWRNALIMGNPTSARSLLRKSGRLLGRKRD